MLKHDELSLELLEQDPCALASFFFAGNEQRALSKLQTLCFPEKFDTLVSHYNSLQEPQTPLQFHVTPRQQFQDQFRKRLLSEFPEKSDEIEEIFKPTEDDFSEDTEEDYD